MKRITSLFLIFVLLAVISIVPINAVSIYIDGDYSYADVDQENVALYDYRGESDILVIPDQFSGRKVSEVYDYAFEKNTSITAIDFSQNDGWLKNLGVKCFAECTSISGDLVIPSSVRKMALGSFQGCTGITSLTINTGLREIPRQCFNRCSSLQNVYLPADLEYIDDLAFGNCDNLDKVYIPKSVYYISDSAFSRSDPILYVYTDSYAHHYAENKRIPYVLVDLPKLGDVNGDGNVDILDSTEIQKFAAEKMDFTDEQFELGDINDDGFVDVIDALLVQKYVVGKYDIPPIIYNS